MLKVFPCDDIVMFFIQVPWRWVMALLAVNSWVILSRFKQWPSAKMIPFSSQVNIANMSYENTSRSTTRDPLLVTWHYNDVKMGSMASQITSLTIVHSTVLFRRRSKKTSKLRVTGLCSGNSPVNSPHKRTVTRKMFPFDDVILV